MLTEDITIQSEPEKQDESDCREKVYNLSVFELKFSNPSDFEMNFLEGVRFRFKSFTTRQILD